MIVKNSTLGRYGFFGTLSKKGTGAECPPDGSWENYCECMYPAGPDLDKCLSKPAGGGWFCPPWASPPWTTCGKDARWGENQESLVGTAKTVQSTAAQFIPAQSVPAIPGAAPIMPSARGSSVFTNAVGGGVASIFGGSGKGVDPKTGLMIAGGAVALGLVAYFAIGRK